MYINQETASKFSGLKIGLVFDVPHMLDNLDFPACAMQEWESSNTIIKIRDTWESLGLTVEMFPLNESFWKRWRAYASQIDVVHTLVEGFGSMDRESWIPSLCQLSGISCIGSEPRGHSLGMDKSLSLLLAQSLGITVAPFFLVQTLEEVHGAELRQFLSQIKSSFVFVKPNGEGSGIGISARSIVPNKECKVIEVLSEQISPFPEGVLVQEHLPGSEFTLALVGNPLTSLPLAQVRVPGGVYGEEIKTKSFMPEELLFDTISSDLERKMARDCERFCARAGIRDLVRFDWKMDGLGRMTLLEVNTLPGLSFYYSVLPKLAERGGYSYAKLFQLILESSLSQTSTPRQLSYSRAFSASRLDLE